MSELTPEQSDLIEKYADTCCAVGRLERAVESIDNIPGSVRATLNSAKKRKANLESQITQLFAEAEERGRQTERQRCAVLISDLTDSGECWFDHHGYCQEHGWTEDEIKCPHARAKEFLGAIEGRG